MDSTFSAAMSHLYKKGAILCMLSLILLTGAFHAQSQVMLHYSAVPIRSGYQSIFHFFALIMLWTFNQVNSSITTTSIPTTIPNTTTNAINSTLSTTVQPTTTANALTSTMQPTTTANATTSTLQTTVQPTTTANALTSTMQPTTTANATTSTPQTITTQPIPTNSINASNTTNNTRIPSNTTITISNSSLTNNESYSAKQNLTSSLEYLTSKYGGTILVTNIYNESNFSTNLHPHGNILSHYGIHPSGVTASNSTWNSTHYLGPMQLRYGQFDNMSPINSSELSQIVSYLSPYIGSNQNASILLFNESIRVPYGKLSSGGRYFGAGDVLHYVSYDKSHILTIYNISIERAIPRLGINVAGANITIPNKSISIYVPILPGQKSYNLRGEITGSLLYGNKAPFYYSIKVGDNIVYSGSETSNSTYMPVNITLLRNQSATIEVSTNGNLNYTAVDPIASIVPTNIVNYVPITFTNSQTVGIPDPFQLNVTVNSLYYNSYEAANLINIEFFYTNGTLVPSWLEGNSLNSAQVSGLYTSENTVYWLRVVGNFLKASSSNTLFMGFASPTQNVFDGVVTGEAPQLSST